MVESAGEEELVLNTSIQGHLSQSDFLEHDFAIQVKPGPFLSYCTVEYKNQFCGGYYILLLRKIPLHELEPLRVKVNSLNASHSAYQWTRKEACQASFYSLNLQLDLDLSADDKVLRRKTLEKAFWSETPMLVSQVQEAIPEETFYATDQSDSYVARQPHLVFDRKLEALKVQCYQHPPKDSDQESTERLMQELGRLATMSLSRLYALVTDFMSAGKLEITDELLNLASLRKQDSRLLCVLYLLKATVFVLKNRLSEASWFLLRLQSVEDQEIQAYARFLLWICSEDEQDLKNAIRIAEKKGDAKFLRMLLLNTALYIANPKVNAEETNFHISRETATRTEEYLQKYLKNVPEPRNLDSAEQQDLVFAYLVFANIAASAKNSASATRYVELAVEVFLQSSDRVPELGKLCCRFYRRFVYQQRLNSILGREKLENIMRIQGLLDERWSQEQEAGKVYQATLLRYRGVPNLTGNGFVEDQKEDEPLSNSSHYLR